MSEPLSVAEVLDRAADLIEPEGAWTQRYYFRKIDGRLTDRSHADCFCAVGALTAASGRSAYPAMIENGEIGAALKAVLPERATEGTDGESGIHVWNDAPGRTQAEVIAKLREAADLARARSAEFGNIGADGVQS